MALLNFSTISEQTYLLFSKGILNVSKYFDAPFVRLYLLHFDSQLLEISNLFFYASAIILQFIKSLLDYEGQIKCKQNEERGGSSSVL